MIYEENYEDVVKMKVAKDRLYPCHLKAEPVCDRTRSEYEI